MPEYGVWCKCTDCRRSKPGKGLWKSVSTARRHHLKDLGSILEQHVAADDLVDKEREGRLAPELPYGIGCDVQQCAPESQDHDEVEEDSASDDNMEEAPEVNDVFSDKAFNGWEEDLMSDDGPPEKVLVGELLLTYFEWMCVHKVTNECARAVHTMLSLLVPPNASRLPEWSDINRMLDTVYKHVVVEVDLCPNDCIAFVNAQHPVLVEAGFMHGHRTACPKCGAARYKRKLEGGKQVAVKRGYYFPVDQFVSSIFRDTQTECHRQHNTGTFPPGHVRRSKGFYEKVTANPHMNKESRNQAFIGMADGIPLFRSLKTSLGVVVGALRQANQPDYISKLFNKIHLSFLYPGEYWAEDKKKQPYLHKAKPSNLSPMIRMLVDDLLQWYDGKQVTDYSMAEDDPARTALIRCVLLFWCGDYPGLGEATNFSHHGASAHACHWCKVEGDHSTGLSRMVYAGYRRYCFIFMCVA
jgi:hypothetical protein